MPSISQKSMYALLSFVVHVRGALNEMVTGVIKTTNEINTLKWPRRAAFSIIQIIHFGCHGSWWSNTLTVEVYALRTHQTMIIA